MVPFRKFIPRNERNGEVYSERALKSRSKKFFISLFFIFLFSASVSAIPPVIQSSQLTRGYQIDIPQQGTLKQGQDYNFFVHLTNLTDGYPVDNTSTVCYLHLYNSSGSHILDLNSSYVLNDAKGEWSNFVSGGNFSNIGTYCYREECYSTPGAATAGGPISVCINVTPTGINQNSVLENPVLIILLFFSLILTAMGIYQSLPAAGFIGSLLMIVAGVYTMIYGFNNYADLYTQSAALVMIGIGFILMFISSYEWIPWINGGGDADDE